MRRARSDRAFLGKPGGDELSGYPPGGASLEAIGPHDEAVVALRSRRKQHPLGIGQI
jgi:hypothetical protein